MVKFHQKPDLRQKVWSVQIFSISVTRPTSDSRNSEVADRLESDDEPSESLESYLSVCYSEIQEFQVCLSFGILFLPTVVLSSSVFSSFADAQNSVTSKPSVR
jgi:hypothetical protein